MVSTEAEKCTLLGPLPMEFEYVVSDDQCNDRRQSATIGDPCRRRKWSLKLLLLTLALHDKIYGACNKEWGARGDMRAPWTVRRT